LARYLKTGLYGDFDFDIMAVGKECKHVQNLYVLNSHNKEYNIEEYTNLIPGIFLDCITWIIHGSSLPDFHAALATTMLFKIYVVGCEAQGMRLWFFTANAL